MVVSIGNPGYGVRESYAASSTQDVDPASLSMPPFQQQVASLLVTLNRYLQANATTVLPAAAAILTVRQAVDAYRAGALPQAFQLAQSAMAYLTDVARVQGSLPSRSPS
jgi:hypothetical protein